ncbi:MAG: O-antigen ligase family protein [Chitinophagales bacterium]|jgi:hypothetical protein|nr:O-antigen ligase family protein [Sphingobacteriales bacterium]MBP9141874.1 O-antigen ligase family protein [Chitinophagales bacterium]MDA0199296.1 O-antigen ligase family protein [Bacteroidota bacterium]MBK6888744.1 O-antigen ligase family protein [Sphingobacteriales bacterium]MBL0246850.1 O-antigen ligase family protein [Sphingobacteriales bacterium]
MTTKNNCEFIFKPWAYNLQHILWIGLFFGLPLSKGIASVALIGIIIFTAVWLFARFKPAIYLIWQYKGVSVLILLPFAYLLGMVHTENIKRGFDFLYIINALLAVPIAVIAYRKQLFKHLSTYIWSFLLSLWVSCLGVLLLNFIPHHTAANIVQAANGLMLPFQAQSQNPMFGLYSPFIDRLHLCNMLVLGVFTLFWWYVQRLKRPVQPSHQVAFFSTLLLLVSTIAILGGRAGQIGFVLALAVWVIVFYKQVIHIRLKKRLGKTGSIAVLAITLLVFMVVVPYTTSKTIPAVYYRYEQLRWEISMLKSGDYQSVNYTEFTSLRRLLSWQNHWQLVAQNWIWGVGTGDVRPELGKIYERTNQKQLMNIHHQWLYIWSALGVAGLLLLVWVWWLWLRSVLFLQQQAPINSWLSAWAISFFILYMVVFNSDIPLNTQAGTMGFALFWSLIGLAKFYPFSNE